MESVKMVGIKRYVVLLGVGLFVFLLVALIDIALRGCGLEFPVFAVGPVLIICSRIKWRLPVAATCFISALGYFAFFAFWTWVLLGFPKFH